MERISRLMSATRTHCSIGELDKSLFRTTTTHFRIYLQAKREHDHIVRIENENTYLLIGKFQNFTTYGYDIKTKIHIKPSTLAAGTKFARASEKFGIRYERKIIKRENETYARLKSSPSSLYTTPSPPMPLSKAKSL